MEKQKVYELLAEVCQEDVVVEQPDIDLFEEGLLDSFGIITFLVEVEESLVFQFQLQSLRARSGIHRIVSQSS